jgi:hypothetical protein
MHESAIDTKAEWQTDLIGFLLTDNRLVAKNLSVYLSDATLTSR